MMQPKRTKYRKQFKGNLKGSSHRGSSVAFGDFALKATDRSRMTAREIEAARRAMTRYVKRGGQIWIRVFPDVPITQKPLEVRMGSGKGNVEYWVAKVTPGQGAVRDRGRAGGHGARGIQAGGGQAVGIDGLRQAAGALMSRKNVKERARSLTALRGKTRVELRKELAELRREQFNLRMAAASGQPARPDQHAKAMGKIARVKTILNEMDRADAGSKA